MNSNVFEISPRMDPMSGVWVFDDESREIKDEPFVGNTNVMISTLVENLPESENGFTVQFSREPFDGCYVLPLERDKRAMGGYWYSLRMPDGITQYGWLCKVLYKYFDVAPLEIWFKVMPI